ncbi:MAG: hypothetical protein JNL52_10835 [Flavobacteriales bacterium]|nr:hypothetical protein [Flavobacteriales bacterium]
MRISIATSLLLLATRVLAQQDAASILKTMGERMAHAKSYHAVARVEMYGPDGRVISRENSEAFVASDRARTITGNRTTVMTPTEFMVVDKAAHTILYQERTTPLRTAASDAMRTQLLAELEKAAKDLHVLAQDARTITLRASDEAGPYAHTDIVLDRTSFTIRSITYHVSGLSRDLGKGQLLDKIVVTYTTFELDRPIPAERFTTRDHVRRSADGRLVPAPGLEHFQLIQSSGN